MTIEEARDIVFKAKPAFAEIYFKYKDKKWSSYIEENYPHKFSQNDKFDELLFGVKQILEPLLGEKKTTSALHTLKKTGFVSTCDHSGLLCHPFFSNITIARSECINSQDSIISFTCGAVSLTNSSFPRSLFFHDQNLTLKKIHLASLFGRRRSVYGLPSFPLKKIDQILEQINTLSLHQSKKDTLAQFFKKIKDKKEIFLCERYSDQLTILNEMLWQQLFDEQRGTLVYVEAEQIIRHLLLHIHFQKETDIHKIIFDQSTRERYLHYYEGITGAHNTEKKSGSHLFWYINEIEQTRVQLFVENENLVSLDKKIKIPLKEDVLREYLLRFELLPTMALCYSILSFYYGLTLGGGFSQIKYLSQMKDAWEKTFNLDTLEQKTNIFSGEFTLLGITDSKTTKPATLFDLFLYSENPEQAVKEALSNVSIGESIDAMMEEFVEIITGTKPFIENLHIHKTLYVTK